LVLKRQLLANQAGEFNFSLKRFVTAVWLLAVGSTFPDTGFSGPGFDSRSVPSPTKCEALTTNTVKQQTREGLTFAPSQPCKQLFARQQVFLPFTDLSRL